MPAGFKIPGIGSATRSLRMDLTSDKQVNAQSKAECAVPEGMKLGPKVNLEIDLPVPEKPAPEGSKPDDSGKTEKTKFTIKMYWECSETVPAGQPKVMDSDTMMKGLPADSRQFQKMMQSQQRMLARAADESHAYWPGSKAKPIKDDAATPGLYQLTTNYCGGTSITFDNPQDFLAPIDVTSPGKGGVDLEKAIKIEWKSVPNAEAYVLTAFASKDNVMVMWTSSSQPDEGTDYMSKPLSKAEVKSNIDKGLFLPPAKTLCNIPAGIFKDVGNPMLTLTAIGTDKTQEKDGIRTAVTVRSTAVVMLGVGMDMDSQGDAPTDQTTEQATDQPAATDSGNAADTSSQSTSKSNKVKDALKGIGGLFKH
jgi:hypothetical protein